MPKQVIRTLFLRVAGMSESDLDQLISPVYKKYENPATTILAANGDLQVHLRARCNTVAEADALLAEVGGPIELLLGDRLYSRNGDPLEAGRGRDAAQEPRDGRGGGKRDRRHARRAIHVGGRQLGVFRRRLHHVHERDEDRTARACPRRRWRSSAP